MDIPRASFLVTLKGIINLVTLLLILPQLYKCLGKYTRISPVLKDLYVVQGSAWLLTIGTILMSIAAEAPIFILDLSFLASGWGFYSALRSLATALVLPSQVGVLNSGISLAQSVGSLMAGPMLAVAFRHDLQMDGLGMGLPYMTTGDLFSPASALTRLIRVPAAGSEQ
ncbi:hypothetical protein BJX63DRAFT_401172 [Aspergillus granulosus]|uniref:Uncharacterized protein n=1 Tax=Aspergillus granulosus TaxID=176169 RepID=A0ABR4H5N7_9EURO